MTSSTPDRRPRVAVLGSGATRGAFDLPEAARFDLVKYWSGSVLGSFMGRRSTVIEPEYKRISSKAHQLMVGADVAKLGRKWLRSDPFDVLVIDLVNERLPLARFSDGGFVTVTSGFRELGIPFSQYTKIQSHTDESWRRWRAGWTSLCDLLDQIGARDRVVVHRAHWASWAADGTSTVEDSRTVESANRWLDAAYEYMTAQLEPHQFIGIDPRLQVADPHHPEGPAPFHYTSEYYRELLRYLDDTLLGR